MTSQDHILSKEQSQGQLPLSWEASGLDVTHGGESAVLHLSELWSPEVQSGEGTGVPMAGLVQGSREVREVKGATRKPLWALNSHHCCSG